MPDSIVKKYQDYFWVAIVLSTLVANSYYAGYYAEIGIGFIGLVNSSDIFYNISSAFAIISYLVLGGALLGSLVSIIKNIKWIVIPALLVLSFGFLALQLSLVGDKEPIWDRLSFVFMFAALSLAGATLCVRIWPPNEIHKYALLAATAICALLLAHASGRLSAQREISVPVPQFSITTQDGIIRGKILRSGQSGILYAQEGKVGFVSSTRVLSVQREEPAASFRRNF